MVGVIALAEVAEVGSGRRHIVMMEVAPDAQGQGFGNALLQLLTADADSTGTTLSLHVAVPTGAPPKAPEELRDWFSAHGFVVTDEEEPFRMVREPVRAESTEKSLRNA